MIHEQSYQSVHKAEPNARLRCNYVTSVLAARYLSPSELEILDGNSTDWACNNF
jgi:hypothetical protein